MSNETIDKYFRFLKHLDINSKKRLIIKLTESIEAKGTKGRDAQKLFGAWEDDRDSDEIIDQILQSRIDGSDKISL